jgi:hypothetical protein
LIVLHPSTTMTSSTQHTPCDTRQFLAAMCAQAHSQLGVQAVLHNPHGAVLAQANLDLATVLDLLRD